MDIEQEGDSVSATVSKDNATALTGADDSRINNKSNHNQESFGLEAQGATTDDANEESEISSVVSGATAPSLTGGKKKKKKNKRRRNKNRARDANSNNMNNPNNNNSDNESHHSGRTASKVASNETLHHITDDEDKPIVVTTYVCSSSELDKVRRLIDENGNPTTPFPVSTQSLAKPVSSTTISIENVNDNDKTVDSVSRAEQQQQEVEETTGTTTAVENDGEQICEKSQDKQDGEEKVETEPEQDTQKTLDETEVTTNNQFDDENDDKIEADNEEKSVTEIGNKPETPVKEEEEEGRIDIEVDPVPGDPQQEDEAKEHNNDEEGSQVRCKSSVNVIFKVGAAVFENPPQSLTAVDRTSSKESHQITADSTLTTPAGAAEGAEAKEEQDVDSNLLPSTAISDEPIVKYEQPTAPSIGELWMADVVDQDEDKKEIPVIVPSGQDGAGPESGEKGEVEEEDPENDHENENALINTDDIILNDNLINNNYLQEHNYHQDTNVNRQVPDYLAKVGSETSDLDQEQGEGRVTKISQDDEDDQEHPLINELSADHLSHYPVPDVPNPSVQNQDGLVNLDHLTVQPPSLHPHSLARLALLKRENPGLVSFSQVAVDKVLNSAQEFINNVDEATFESDDYQEHIIKMNLNNELKSNENEDSEKSPVQLKIEEEEEQEAEKEDELSDSPVLVETIEEKSVKSEGEQENEPEEEVVEEEISLVKKLSESFQLNAHKEEGEEKSEKSPSNLTFGLTAHCKCSCNKLDIKDLKHDADDELDDLENSSGVEDEPSLIDEEPVQQQQQSEPLEVPTDGEKKESQCPQPEVGSKVDLDLDLEENQNQEELEAEAEADAETEGGETSTEDYEYETAEETSLSMSRPDELSLSFDLAQADDLSSSTRREMDETHELLKNYDLNQSKLSSSLEFVSAGEEDEDQDLYDEPGRLLDLDRIKFLGADLSNIDGKTDRDEDFDDDHVVEESSEIDVAPDPQVDNVEYTRETLQDSQTKDAKAVPQFSSIHEVIEPQSNDDNSYDDGPLYNDEQIRLILSSDKSTMAKINRSRGVTNNNNDINSSHSVSSLASSMTSDEDNDIIKLPRVPNPSVENHQGLAHLVVHPPTLNAHTFARLVPRRDKVHMRDFGGESQQLEELEPKSPKQTKSKSNTKVSSFESLSHRESYSKVSPSSVVSNASSVDTGRTVSDSFLKQNLPNVPEETFEDLNTESVTNETTSEKTVTFNSDEEEEEDDDEGNVDSIDLGLELDMDIGEVKIPSTTKISQELELRDESLLLLPIKKRSSGSVEVKANNNNNTQVAPSVGSRKGREGAPLNRNWVIDPHVIEDALTESEMGEPEPKATRSSIIKNLWNCFGKRGRDKSSGRTGESSASTGPVNTFAPPPSNNNNNSSSKAQDTPRPRSKFRSITGRK